MATISKVRTPRPLARTARWAEPGSKSATLFARAQGVLPGGNSRTTVYMAPYPPYAAAGQGCWITDVEGDRRLDCLNNYTALIHGHAHPTIVEAATRRLALGASFPMPTPEEIDLAALLCDGLPSAERERTPGHTTTPWGAWRRPRRPGGGRGRRPAPRTRGGRRRRCSRTSSYCRSITRSTPSRVSSARPHTWRRCWWIPSPIVS